MQFQQSVQLLKIRKAQILNLGNTLEARTAGFTGRFPLSVHER